MLPKSTQNGSFFILEAKGSIMVKRLSFGDRNTLRRFK